MSDVFELSLTCDPTVSTNLGFTYICFISVPGFRVDWHQDDLKCYWASCRCAKLLGSAEFLLRNNLMLLLS